MRLSKCGPNDAMEEILEQGMQSSGGVRMSRVYVHRGKCACSGCLCGCVYTVFLRKKKLTSCSRTNCFSFGRIFLVGRTHVILHRKHGQVKTILLVNLGPNGRHSRVICLPGS